MIHRQAAAIHWRQSGSTYNGPEFCLTHMTGWVPLYVVRERLDSTMRAHENVEGFM